MLKLLVIKASKNTNPLIFKLKDNIAQKNKLCYHIGTMTNTNVEVIKNNNENTVSLIRRFTKKVRSAGVLKRVRSIRYNQRDLSPSVRKKQALKRIEKTAEITKLQKLGKLVETKNSKR